MLGSHPDFLAASHEDRWKILARYVGLVLQPSTQVDLIEALDAGLPELLKMGMGVCRHLSTLMAAVLKEAGYDARIMWRSNDGQAHAWVKVVPPAGSKAAPWVFDLMNSMVLDLKQAEREVNEFPEGLTARWYRHPGRAEFPNRPAT